MFLGHPWSTDSCFPIVGSKWTVEPSMLRLRYRGTVLEFQLSPAQNACSDEMSPPALRKCRVRLFRSSQHRRDFSRMDRC